MQSSDVPYVASGSVTALDVYTSMTKHKVGVLSTIGPNGKPQSALMGFAITPQLELVFDTVNSSRKYPNLIARPACSFVVGGWGIDEQTIQYEGEAAELKPPELARYQEVYFAVWIDGPARKAWPRIAYFVVRPRWVRYSDFGQSPPRISELTFQSQVLSEPGTFL